MTLRLMSPQAPSVVSRVALIAAIVVLRFGLSTPWSWKLCRVVTRSVPLPYLPQMSSIARYWSAVSFPPGSLSRIMNMYDLPTPAFDAVLAGVAIFLLVAAVELDEALVDLAEMLDRGIDHFLGERAAEKPPLDLVPLNRGELRLGQSFGGHHTIQKEWASHPGPALWIVISYALV